MYTDISIIIVNFNTTNYLKKLLNSINSNFSSIETIVVDNNSTDRQIENLIDEFPGIQFHLRKINDGFGSGCNYGANKASGKYLLFLNPDIILLDDSIIKLRMQLESEDSIGVISGFMVDKVNLPIYCFNDFPSFEWEFYQIIGYGYNRKISELINRKEIQENKNFEVDWFHGAFFMLRKSDYEKIGGFNENYFMYMEDIDICYQIQTKLKKKNICVPYVRVFHHTQSSINNYKNDDLYSFHMTRGKLLFFQNYKYLKRKLLYLMSTISVLLRILILPIWGKYSSKRRKKFEQLVNLLKLHFDKKYLYSSKLKYLNSK